jgi:predicted alternative tryptophan synthase beta-subunit
MSVSPTRMALAAPNPTAARSRAAALKEIDLTRVQEAQARVRPHIRRSPIMHAWLPTVDGGTGSIHLKLENLQVAGGADVRGVLNFALGLPHDVLAKVLVTVSWGNVGSAVAYVGHILGVDATVYLTRPCCWAGSRRRRAGVSARSSAPREKKGSSDASSPT